MKIQIDLGTVDVEMQRSDGTWEKVDHCHTRIRIEKSVLSVDLKAVLTGEVLLELKKNMIHPLKKYPKDENGYLLPEYSHASIQREGYGDAVKTQEDVDALNGVSADTDGAEPTGCKPE